MTEKAEARKGKRASSRPWRDRRRPASIREQRTGGCRRNLSQGEIEERSLTFASQPIHRNESEKQKRWLAPFEMTDGGNGEV
jgi:hypothetical protein